MDLVRLPNGFLPHHTSVGDPLFFIDGQAEVLCPDCANRADVVIAMDVNSEHPALQCDACGTRISCNYAEV